MPDRSEFQLGIAMAGAISAGAYSGGVMDFFIEALDAYDRAKSQPDWDGPIHDVRIPVMAGASAGGMTAAITALQLFHGLEHVWPGKAAPAPAANRLYSSWVTDISIEALLETADLANGRDKAGLKSALCCDVLTKILDDALKLSGAVRVPNWIGKENDRSMRLLLTLTNLRGVPYSFGIFGANAGERYGMLNHGDYLDFTIGAGPSEVPGSHLLDIRGAPSGPDWNLFRAGALATGAFPIGLAPRSIERDPSDYANAERVGIESKNFGFVSIPPDVSFGEQTPYAFISVDGGAIDNEPLELARRYLAGVGQRNQRNGDTANKAVILVAPFPNFVHTPDPDADDRVIHVLPKLMSTLIDQARFKPDELALAEDSSVFSRFMISPIRKADNNPLAVKYPIASGSLAGFGGFLHQSFRRHDYLLGRRNAQAFLRWNLVLPETNILFNGYNGNRERWYVRDPGETTDTVPATIDLTAPAKKYARSIDAPQDTKGLPIIPLTEALRRPIEIGEADLPKPDEICRDALFELIRCRAQRVVATLVDVDLLSVTRDNTFLGPILRAGARQYGTEAVTKKASALVNEAIRTVKGAFK